MKYIFTCLLVSATLAGMVQAHDVTLRNEGIATLGVSYPDDWKIKVGKDGMLAISDKGDACSTAAFLKASKTEAEGVEEIKKGFAEFASDLVFDEPTKVEGDALVISGKGKDKKSGNEMVFGGAVFKASAAKLATVMIIVQADVQEFYKVTSESIFSSILVEKDFPENAPAAPETVK